MARAARGWTGRGLRRERWHGYLFIAPAYLFLAVVVLLPLGNAAWTSLLRVRGLSTRFVGLGNYARVLADDAFWNSLRVSLVFTAVCVVMHMALGFALALLLNRAGRLRGLLRLAMLVPWMIAPAIGATIWLWLLDPQFGVVNHLLLVLRVIRTPQIWLGEPGLALASVAVVDIWRGVPFVMLLLMAGLLGIPAEQYEAASLDGASAWQQFRYVTLPNMRALLVIVSTLDVLNTVRQFDLIAVMTGGGPTNATEVLPALIYNIGFRANRLGDAAATGMVLLALVLLFSGLYVRLLRPAGTEA
ncbi:MAG TPA: sugar ABC transporter permease [Acetobacteraceae bacterium]